MFNQLFKPGAAGNLCAILAGAALTFAFAPFNLYPLAILSPALLLGLWLSLTPGQAFFRGWLFGLGFFANSVYWIFISINTFGEAPIWLSGIITSGFIAYIAVFIGITGYVLNRYFTANKATKLIFAFPAVWVFFEWVRSWLFSGFPWVLLGYSQTNTPLCGFAPIVSVYGVSLATLLTSGFLVNAMFQWRQKKRLASSLNLLWMVILWLTGFVLSTITWTEPDGKPIQVSLIQGNIPQMIKWSPDQIKPTLDRYEALSTPHWDSKIIVWPESAIPLPFLQATDFLSKMDKIAKSHHAALITGIPIKAVNRDAYLNSVIVLGDGHGIYHKHRLVPFGEYTPMPKVLGWMMKLMNIPMSDFIPGEGTPKPLQIGDLKIATFICYEIAYPEQVLGRDGQVGALLTVSNDAWFGHSIAQAQHVQMAQMRALELGRPVLFVSNNGITATINAQGKIQKAAPPYEPAVVTDTIQPTKGKTPWQNSTMDRVLITVLLMLIIAWKKRRSKK